MIRSYILSRRIVRRTSTYARRTELPETAVSGRTIPPSPGSPSRKDGIRLRCVGFESWRWSDYPNQSLNVSFGTHDSTVLISSCSVVFLIVKKKMLRFTDRRMRVEVLRNHNELSFPNWRYGSNSWVTDFDISCLHDDIITSNFF